MTRLANRRDISGWFPASQEYDEETAVRRAYATARAVIIVGCVVLALWVAFWMGAFKVMAL